MGDGLADGGGDGGGGSREKASYVCEDVVGNPEAVEKGEHHSPIHSAK